MRTRGRIEPGRETIGQEDAVFGRDSRHEIDSEPLEAPGFVAVVGRLLDEQLCRGAKEGGVAGELLGRRETDEGIARKDVLHLGGSAALVVAADCPTKTLAEH